MWGRLLTGAALAFLPSAALACSCDDPARLSPAQLESDLKLIAGRQLHIGRLVKLGTTLPGQARRYQVLEDLTGNLPREVVIWPFLTRLPDGSFVEGPVTSCDHDIEVGKLSYMAFQARDGRFQPAPCGVLGPANDSGLRSAGLCTKFWLDNARLRQRLVAAVRAQPGVRRSSRPASSSR